MSESNLPGGGVASYMGAQVMDRALPEGSVVGSWDAGVIGYFSRFPVVNLDGLVNSYNHLRARPVQLKEDQLKEDLDFYRRYGVTHFANYRRHDRIPNNPIFQGAPFDSWHDMHRFTLWTYDPSPSETRSEKSYSQEIWDNMKPGFDYLSDGVGIVLNGRMAQAFAKDCAPNKPLVWTWNEQEYERILIEPGLYRSGANMCVARRVLPRGDGQPQQVKIAPLNHLADLTTERDPIIQSRFNVHLANGSLIYAKSQCGEAEVEARFFANIYPVDADDLPARLRQRGYETIDFNFYDYGAIAADERCWAAINLPNYPIAEMHAGQYAELADGYVHIWDGAYRLE